MTGLKPCAASWSRRCDFAASSSVDAAVLSLTVVTPSSAFALSVPAAAESLNDASPRPPTSKASATLSLLPSTFSPAWLELVEAAAAAGGFGAVTQLADWSPVLALLLFPAPESFAHPASTSAPAMAAAASAVPRMRRNVCLPPR